MKEKIFNIIQIGDKSNRLSRAFDIFIHLFRLNAKYDSFNVITTVLYEKEIRSSPLFLLC